MAEVSEITWTGATYNPWIGCTKVGPGCDFCYAERDNKRRKWVTSWGPGVPRTRTKTAKDLHKWNRQHEEFMAEHGHRRRVFSASLADIFDNEVPEPWRADFWADVKACTNLDFYIVTKRMPNVAKMLPPDWGPDYAHVVLIITVVNQDEADRDIPRLVGFKMQHPWLRVGLSVEPQVGEIDLARWVDALDWVIAGGESDGGAGTARPIELAWVRQLRDQCHAAGVPFHFKQWGEIADTGERVGTQLSP